MKRNGGIRPAFRFEEAKLVNYRLSETITKKKVYFCRAEASASGWMNTLNMEQNKDYLFTTLANGLRVVHRPADNEVSYCGFMIDAGTRDESGPDGYGMAHFIEHILFKGTTRRNSWHINNRMEAVGGELNAFTTKEDTTFYSIFLHRDFARACELLCDLLCHSTAPEQELRKEQAVVIDEINSYLDNPPEWIYDEFEEHLFAGHPLGHGILGTEETVHGFNSRACLDFIARYYRPERTIFFSYGKTPWKQVVKCVEKYYDRAATPPESSQISFRAGREAAPIEREADAVATLAHPLVIQQETHQAHVMLGSRSYPIGNRKGAALALLNNLLGGPGMNSRLNQELREKRGLVYTVESSLTHYTDNGVFSIYFGCDCHDTQRCLHLILTQLKHLRDKALSSSQLHAAQKQLKGQLGVGTANLESTAIHLAKGILRLGHCETLEEACRRIDEVTPEHILEVANEILDEKQLRCVIIK